MHLQARRRRAGLATLPPLILMTDADRLPDPFPAAARLPRGSAVILRHYGTDAREGMARLLGKLCRRRGVRLLIADDARLAARVGADGLHLPEYRVRTGRRYWTLWRRPGWIVTAAAHDTAAMRHALLAGADAVLLSPVFATASHPGGRAIGALRFALWAGRSPVAVYALGGIDSVGARRLAAGNVCGFAGISGIAPS